MEPQESGTAAPHGEPVDSLVAQLEKTDVALLALIRERLAVAQRLGEAHGRAYDTPWLARALDDASAAADSATSAPSQSALRAVFRELLLAQKQAARRVRAAFLGPLYSFSHLAALERFGASGELIPVATVSAVFEEVAQGHADYGLAPLENSTDGRIADTITMFARMPLKICGEVWVPIHHNLVACCERNEIEEVYSKPQVLSQCRDWLARHLPAARLVETASSAVAAQRAARSQTAAAVCSRQAAVRYELNVLAENIEDNPNNVTRFAVIGNQPAAPTPRDKTTILFQIPHQPGALADAMAIFKRNQLNLTWIESFPAPGQANQYFFFAELEGAQRDAPMAEALRDLQSLAVRLDVLGSYPAEVRQ